MSGSTRPEVRERWLTTANGTRLFYRDYGDPLSQRRPLLCLPGLARNGDDYRDFALRHAPARRVVCPDYRGRGRSDRESDWRQYAAPATVDDIRHLIAASGLHDVVIVGTSYGGLLATALGVVVPRTIAGVVLNDIGPAVETGAQARILSYIAEAPSQPDWPSALRHIRETLPDLSFETDEEWMDFARGTYEPDGQGSLHARWDPAIAKPFMDGSEIPDLWALFGSIRHLPLLLVRGGRSHVVTAETARRMAEAHPGMRECLVPAAGHAPTLDEPESRTAIASFLDDLDASAGR